MYGRVKSPITLARRDGLCGGIGLFVVASNMPSQGSIGCGEQKRFSIPEPDEYGIPRKELTPSFVNPRISPKLVLIIQSLFRLEIFSSFNLSLILDKRLILAQFEPPDFQYPKNLGSPRSICLTISAKGRLGECFT